MKIDGDTVIFSTGKERSANCGIIGLEPYHLEVTEGYDGGFHNDDWWDEPDKLTAAEQIELADYMIELWGKFKEKAA